MSEHVISVEALGFVGWWVGTFLVYYHHSHPLNMRFPWEEMPSYCNAMEQNFWKEPGRQMCTSGLDANLEHEFR